MVENSNKPLWVRRPHVAEVVSTRGPLGKLRQDQDSLDAQNRQKLLDTKATIESKALPLTLNNYIEHSGLTDGVVRRMIKRDLTLKYNMKIEDAKPGPRSKTDEVDGGSEDQS